MASETFWTSTTGLFKTVEILRVLVYVSTGVFVCETISSASFDWSLLSGKRQRRWTHVVYFSAKLSYLAFLIQIITAFWLENAVDCQAYLYAWEFLMGLTVITSSSLLALRTIAVHHSEARTLVTAIIVVLGLALTAAWMQGVTDVTAAWVTAAASPWNSGACLWTAVKPTYYVKYVVTIVFDLVVVLLTVVGIKRMNSSSQIGNVVIRQGLIYFFITVIANLVITVLTILNLSPTMSLIAAIPQSTICVIASTKLYAQLAEEASVSATKLSKSTSSSTQLATSGSSSKLSTFLRTRSYSRSSTPKQTDVEKGYVGEGHHSAPRSPVRTVKIDDVLEYQTQQKMQGYRPSQSQHHPFSNLAVLDYDAQKSATSLEEEGGR